jgi:hypothetical protein
VQRAALKKDAAVAQLVGRVIRNAKNGATLLSVWPLIIN